MQTAISNRDFHFSPEPEPARLLVVDDDSSVRIGSRLALEHAGFRVTDAPDGYTALNCLQSQHFDAILLDACMPGLDGFATCRKMRERLGGDLIPIVIATGLDDDASIQTAFECGATDFAPKPLIWRIIVQRLHALIHARQATSHLNGRSSQMFSMLKTSSEAVLVLDQCGVIQGRHHIEKLPGAVTAMLEPGCNFFDILPGGCAVRVEKAWKNSLSADSVDEFILTLEAQETAFKLQGRFIAGIENEVLCLLQDQTEAFAAERKMYELAYLDQCTGIANEKRLISELSLRLKCTRDFGQKTVLIRCATPDFQGFEPRLGRHGLDKLACAVVSRLQECVKDFAARTSMLSERLLIARISGSHFGIVLSGECGQESVRTLAQLLSNSLAVCVEIDGFSCPMDWTIGIADSAQATSPDSLLSATAYAIQLTPGLNEPDRVCFYHPTLRDNSYRATELEQLLRRDIADGALEMNYQPKFALTDFSLVGMEALVRWNNREMGPVSPAQFIPVAEHTGQVVALSHLVIERVFDQMVQWREQGRLSVPVSINISGIHLNSETIVQELMAGVDQRQIPCHLVELEVTESIMVQGAGRALKNLNELRSLGFRISVDDFGTGYSSLSYLLELPIDCLKVDRSFITNIADDPTARAIAKAIITVGHDVGLDVIAEGVETPEQLRCLRELQCDSVQGYITGRPVVSDHFADFFGGYRCGSGYGLSTQ